MYNLLGLPEEQLIPEGEYIEALGRVSRCVPHYTAVVNGWRVFIWNNNCFVKKPKWISNVPVGNTIEWRTAFVFNATDEIVWLPDEPIAKLASVYALCEELPPKVRNDHGLLD